MLCHACTQLLQDQTEVLLQTLKIVSCTWNLREHDLPIQLRFVPGRVKQCLEFHVQLSLSGILPVLVAEAAILEMGRLSMSLSHGLH